MAWGRIVAAVVLVTGPVGVGLAAGSADPGTPPAGPTATDEVPGDPVAAMLDRVTEEGYREDVHSLTDFGNRAAGTTSDERAAQWIRDRFNESGLDTWFDEFQDTQNVVGVKSPDRNTTDAYVVIGGHMDGVPNTEEGAEDNASGTAALVAIARATEDLAVDVEVRFIAFGAEEQGLIGSSHYADNAAADGHNITAMFNADMVSYNPSGERVNLFENDDSRWLADVVEQARADYEDRIGLEAVERSPGSANSDHWPFWQNGYSAVFLHSYHFSPCWHDPCDTTDTLNWTYGQSTSRLMAASAADVAGLHWYGDLAVEDVRVLADEPRSGEVVSVEVDVANPARGDVEDLPLELRTPGGTLVQNVTVSGGASDTVTFRWDTTGTVGEATVRAVGDPADVLEEGDETNNAAATNVFVDGPDLEASAPHEVTWDPRPLNPWRIVFEATVENTREEPSDAFTVGFYHDQVDPATRFDTVRVDGLDGGAAADVAGVWEDSRAGDRSIHVVADDRGEVSEWDETDNEASETYPLFLGFPVKADAPDPAKGVELRDEDSDGVPHVWWHEDAYWVESSGTGVEEREGDGWTASGVGDPDEGYRLPD